MILRLLAIIAGTGSLAAPASAAPSDVNAQAFYLDARALETKGMGALFDKRLKPMMAQMKDAGTRARAANLAATNAGKPLYCVPEAAKKKGLGSKEVVATIGRVPDGERRSITLYEAWKRALVRDYPCR